MRKIVLILLGVAGVAWRGFCADADYKQVLIFTNGDFIRVRLPLTDVTGKVRVKERTTDGFGLPVAPSKVSLGEKHYINGRLATTSRTRTAPA
jgi:hypothetical protein